MAYFNPLHSSVVFAFSLPLPLILSTQLPFYIILSDNNVPLLLSTASSRSRLHK
jgi:hypothetical protein